MQVKAAPGNPGQGNSFFAIKPIGVGTSLSESLSSFLMRLACSYGAHICGLASILISVNQNAATKERSIFSENAWLRTCNGYGRVANDLVGTLETFSQLKTVRHATMLAWRNVADPMGHGMLKEYKEWCPQCFETWKNNDQVLYEPLIWFVKHTETCLIHNSYLSQICPSCQERQAYWFHEKGIGYCIKCGQWLGANAEIKNSRLDSGSYKDLVGDTSNWLENAVGELIAGSPNLPDFSTLGIVANNLQFVVGKIANGNRAALARIIGIDEDTLRQWTRGRCLPRFECLMDLCLRLNIRPLGFLTTNLSESYPGDIKPNKLPSYAWLQRTMVSHSKEYLRAELKAFVVLESPPPIEEIATRLKCSVQYLKYHFPVLITHVYRKRKTAKIEFATKQHYEAYKNLVEIIIRFQSAGIHPSRRLVMGEARNGLTFRHNPTLAAMWRKAVSEMGVLKS